MRVLAINDAGTTITVFYEGGSEEVYTSWDDFLKNVELADVETYVDIFGDWYYQNGVPPLTAYPRVGTTTRPAGQGCMNCAYFSGCLATMGLKGDMNYKRSDGGRGICSARTGTACMDYLAAS